MRPQANICFSIILGPNFKEPRMIFGPLKFRPQIDYRWPFLFNDPFAKFLEMAIFMTWFLFDIKSFSEANFYIKQR